MTQIRRPIVLVLIWMLIAAMGGYWIWQSSQTQLVVENFSTDDLTDVVIIVAASPIWAGNVKAETKIRTRFRPQSDSAFVVDGRWQGRKASSSLGYTTKNDRILHKITLTPGGEFLYSVTR